jgi:hypothetical protein
MPLPPHDASDVPAAQEPKYGRVHFPPGTLSHLGFVLALMMSLVWAGFPALPVKLMAAGFAGFMIWCNWKVVLRIPVIETDPDGITLRPGVGTGRIFVQWADANGVVIWHDCIGNSISTMVAISAGDDFAYDNYGLYPAVRRTRNPASGSKVKRHLRSWSVDIGKTSGERIARLVNASGKGVPVVEELPDGDTWNHSGPQWGSDD